MPIWYRKYQNTLLPHCMKDESVLIQNDSFITWYLSARTFLGFLLLQLHEKEKWTDFLTGKDLQLNNSLYLLHKVIRGKKKLAAVYEENLESHRVKMMNWKFLVPQL